MSALESVFFALSVAIPLVALVAGKIPERIAALIFAMNTIATGLCGHFLGFKDIGTILLTID